GQGRGTLFGEFAHRAGRAVPDVQAVAGLDQVVGHGGAHVAEAEQRDLHAGISGGKASLSGVAATAWVGHAGVACGDPWKRSRAVSGPLREIDAIVVRLLLATLI